MSPSRIATGLAIFAASSAVSAALTARLSPAAAPVPPAAVSVGPHAASARSASTHVPSSNAPAQGSSTPAGNADSLPMAAPAGAQNVSSSRAGTFRSDARRSSAPSSAPARAASSSNWDAFRAAMRRGGGGPGDAGDASAASSAAPLLSPTITFDDFTLWWQYDDPVTLAPTSDSDGAFTFESSHPSTLSVAGNVATMGASFRSTVTITARQAAHGGYAAGTATATVTLRTTYCVAEPCLNGATCTPTLGGNGAENFLCTCVDDHYAGVYCEESDLNCQENGGALFCNNGGSCVKDVDGGVCDCAGGFCGTYCEILPSQCGA